MVAQMGAVDGYNTSSPTGLEVHMAYTKVVDDGGARVTYSAGGVRESSAGKGRFDLIAPHALVRLAAHYEHGAQKYSVRGWEQGIPLSSYMDSAFRHLVRFMDGSRSEDHLAAILWNVAGYMQTEKWIAEGRLPEDLKDVPWDWSDTTYAPEPSAMEEEEEEEDTHVAKPVASREKSRRRSGK